MDDNRCGTQLIQLFGALLFEKEFRKLMNFTLITDSRAGVNNLLSSRVTSSCQTRLINKPDIITNQNPAIQNKYSSFN